MKKIILFILLCQIGFPVFSQMNDQLNHDKYWYYRHRLRYDFMREPQFGSSTQWGVYIPAGERGFWGSHDILKGGDGVIELGWYIAMLATEYKLLKENHQPTDVTLFNLFNAINTFNRLDYTAETYYKDASGNWGTASLDGFFIRDDIKNDTYLGGAGDVLRHGLISQFAMNHVQFSESLAIDSASNPRPGGGDQIWYLLMGFRFVTKYVDPGETYPYPVGQVFMDGETNIVAEVQKITNRIWNKLSTDHWIIYNPVTQSNVANGDGGEVEAFAYPVSLIADIIDPAHVHQDAYTVGAGFTFWNVMGTGAGPELQIGCVTGATDSDKFLLLAELSGSWPYASMTAWSVGQKYEYLPIIGQLLWGFPNAIPESTYEDLFSDAPCSGPYEFKDYATDTVHYPDNNWSSRSRFVHPEATHDYPCAANNPPPFEGEYNGLDYMLFHNLYYINHGATDIHDEAQARVISVIYPTGSIGATANPANVVGFESIHCNETIINSGSDVTLHGGYLVSLYEFKAHHGAKFHAYVEPFTCATTTGAYRNMAAPIDSTTTISPVTLAAYNRVKGINTESKDQLVVTPEKSPSRTNAAQSTSLYEQSMLVVLPNPSADGMFKIDFWSNDYSDVKLSVYNIYGVKIKETVLPGEFYDLDIGNEARGIYFVKVENNKGVFTKKVLYQ